MLFRYGIFGHQTNYRQATNDCTSGEWNPIPGNEFIVTLGGFRIGTSPCPWDPDANGFSVGNREQKAKIFMHEVGHTLGLFHGGERVPNSKPNYLSVMNYAFQECRILRVQMGSCLEAVTTHALSYLP